MAQIAKSLPPTTAIIRCVRALRRRIHSRFQAAAESRSSYLAVHVAKCKSRKEMGKKNHGSEVSPARHTNSVKKYL